ncbi:nuclease-related domain-containing protein [Thermococcus henrietii]|uniref:nuclease-related domain-containing protein n=1 Tax=Thermococcus henrietii TaxID=2016361 RepID=UPI000C08CFD4|nr:nuclease-related domain-containing protein [Thermococcus henrietii]
MIYTGEEAIKWRWVYKISSVMAVLFLGLGVFLSKLFFLAAFVSVLISKHAHDKSKRWATGFEGEYYVIEALSECKCFNGVLLSDLMLPGATANIDHVLVCDRGIFAIETKAYTGIYKADGDTWYYETMSGKIIPTKSLSRLAKRNAAILSKFLRERYGERYFVNPMLVFSGATVFEGRATVPVLFPSQICEYVCSLPRTLSKQEVARLSDLLARYARHIMEVGKNAP